MILKSEAQRIIFRVGTYARRNVALTLVFITSLLILILSITSLSGSWVQYRINASATTKQGLFNFAVNGNWKSASYSACVRRINSNSPSAGNERSFCDAQLSAGSLLLFNIFLVAGATIIISLIWIDYVKEKRIRQAKYVVTVIYLSSALLNMIAFSLGAGIMYQLVRREFPEAAYGAGFFAAVINFVLSASIAPIIWILVDKNGVLNKPSTLFQLSEKDVIYSNYY